MNNLRPSSSPHSRDVLGNNAGCCSPGRACPQHQRAIFPASSISIITGDISHPREHPEGVPSSRKHEPRRWIGLVCVLCSVVGACTLGAGINRCFETPFTDWLALGLVCRRIHRRGWPGRLMVMKICSRVVAVFQRLHYWHHVRARLPYRYLYICTSSCTFHACQGSADSG